MRKYRLGKPHVFRSEIVGKNILTCNELLHECVKKSVYRKLKGRKCDFLNDVIGDTYVDMIDYINRSNFDHNRNVSPESYIFQRLSGSIIDNYKKYLQSVKTPLKHSQNKDSNDPGKNFFDNSLYNSTNTLKLGGNDEEDHIESTVDQEFKPNFPDKYIDQKDIRKTLNEILKFLKSTLKKSDRDIFYMRFYKDMTQVEIAKKLKKTSAAISDREKKIISKIKEKFPQKLSLLNI